jgi:hypothetical protein
MSRLFFTGIVMILLANFPAAAAEAPPVGVYSCYDAKMDYKMQLNITPMPFVMFGLINDSTYSDYDGHHGHYRYDAGTGVLTMLDGSREGWRYHKVAGWSFRLIDNKSGTDIYTCPFEAAKNPDRGPW